MEYSLRSSSFQGQCGDAIAATLGSVLLLTIQTILRISVTFCSASEFIQCEPEHKHSAHIKNTNVTIYKAEFTCISTDGSLVVKTAY